MNELVNPRRTPSTSRAPRGPGFRVVAVESLGPLTMLGGIVWAIVQPYRVTFFDPDGKGFYD